MINLYPSHQQNGNRTFRVPPVPTSGPKSAKTSSKTTSNTNIQLIPYQILHRTHYTGSRLIKMGLVNMDICSHCTQNTPDNYMHATWDCTPVKQFWLEITNNLTHLLGCHIPLCPSLCLLGYTSNINLSNVSKRILYISLNIAKKTILMNWKSRKKN